LRYFGSETHGRLKLTARPAVTIGSRAVEYHRFQLLFTTDHAGGYTIHAWTPKGQGEAHFESPRPEADAGVLPPPWRKPQAQRHVALSGEEPASSPETLGEKLFKALFQSEILSLYKSSLDAATDSGTGLRIELTFHPNDPDQADLQALPWESLRQPGTSKFLALNPRTPVTRFLAVPRPVSAAARPQVLRILAVAASPHHPELPSLDLDKELRNLQEAIGSTVQVIPVDPTLAALSQALRNHECHVLHFMGHGGSLAGQKESVLFFETNDKSPDPISGADLANTLAASSTLRLVVLNACESASVPKTGAGAKDFDPFAGVANALVLGDLPAVIAMRRSISDAAAITFSRTFYQQLAASDPIDAAVTEGRRAVHAEPRHRASLEWATPVLFMRTPTGELYPEKDLWDHPPEKSRAARWLAAALLALLLAGGAGFALRHWWVERRVIRLTDEGAALFSQEQWAKARERFQAARRLNPESAEILSNLAGTEERLGDLRAAEDHYREAVRRQPDSAEPLYNLGHFLNSRASSDEAYRFLLQAVERDPQRADAHAELAQAAAALGMPGRARAHLEVALKLAPERPALSRRLGEIELNSGSPQAAIPHLDEAIRRYPLGDLGRVETTWLLAQAYHRLGNTSAACREIREIRRLDPPGITPWAQQAEEMRSRCKARL
jgi:tetratricopeptide (TPR) repeat protein